MNESLPELSEKQRLIVKALLLFGKLTATEISQHTDIPRASVIENIYLINGRNRKGTKISKYNDSIKRIPEIKKTIGRPKIYFEMI